MYIIPFLNGRDGASKQMWAILTALRGPDNESYELKDETTARIRGAIGLADSGVGNGATVSSLSPAKEDASIRDGYSTYGNSEPVIRKYVQKYPGSSKHFIKHYAWAVSALKYFGILSE